jgi:uncharacterized protein YchJ
MDTRTGEIREFKTEAERNNFVADKRKRGEPWWKECANAPSPFQKKHNLKGHHLCLCGSGKKFRDCCQEKKV